MPGAPMTPPGGAEPPSRRARGRPPAHGLSTLRRTVAQLTTRRLDGRSAVAGAVKRWKADLSADLGGDLTRAQQTLVELAAQTWVMVVSLDDWLLRQASLVTRKRTVLPVLLQRQQLADSLARMLERRARDATDIVAQLAGLEGRPRAENSGGSSRISARASRARGEARGGEGGVA